MRGSAYTLKKQRFEGTEDRHRDVAVESQS